MKILTEKPPVWERAAAVFAVDEKTTVFAYNDAIYNPSGKDLPDHLIAHEGLHLEQQRAFGGADLWWDKYLVDNDFRIDQEARAYGVQFAHICKETNDRNERVRLLQQLSNILAGPLYAQGISFNEAVDLIQKYAKIKILK